MSLSSDRRRLSELCEKCGGKCCRGHHIFLSSAEYESLKDKLDLGFGSFDCRYGRFRTLDALSSGRCPFLGGEGCVLEEAARPLICRLFPVFYTVEKGAVRFSVSDKCPFSGEIEGLSDWMEHAVSDAERTLSGEWTRKEVLAYGKHSRG